MILAPTYMQSDGLALVHRDFIWFTIHGTPSSRPDTFQRGYIGTSRTWGNRRRYARL